VFIGKMPLVMSVSAILCRRLEADRRRRPRRRTGRALLRSEVL